VASFTITVTPDDGAGAQTTIRVKTAPGSARITELTVKAAGGGGLSPDELSAVDLDALIAAVAPTGTTTLTAMTTEMGGEVPIEVPSDMPDAASSRLPGKPDRRAKAADVRAAETKAAKGKPRQTAAADAGRSDTGRRAYRRMPEVDQVLDAYRRVGGTTALARYFGVPRHTATGWLRRLRSMGQLQS
jgi:hypothetical protein